MTDDVIEIRLGREYYVISREIYDWCWNTFDEKSWSLSTAFGYQHFKFHNSEDATLFLLTWQGRGHEDIQS